LFLGQSLMRRGDFARATRVLAPLMGGGRADETRTRARTLMTSLADQQIRSAATPVAPAGREPGESDPTGRTRPEPASPVAQPVAGEAPRQEESSPSVDSPPRAGLVLRRMGVGETRVLGVFRAIECARGSAVLLVDGDSGTLRLRTKEIDDVDFISYRADGLSSVNCGVLSAPQRVLVTYRPGTEGSGPTATAGDAVAIELLPDGYTPK
jgi:hypothetical protein